MDTNFHCRKWYFAKPRCPLRTEGISPRATRNGSGYKPSAAVLWKFPLTTQIHFLRSFYLLRSACLKYWSIWVYRLGPFTNWGYIWRATLGSQIPGGRQRHCDSIAAQLFSLPNFASFFYPSGVSGTVLDKFCFLRNPNYISTNEGYTVEVYINVFLYL